MIQETNEQHGQGATPGQNKPVTIIVNGRPRTVSGKDISYQQVVNLAFPDGPAGDGIEYTVSYANPHGRDGTLTPGESVHVKEGMVFNVTQTNRS